MRMCTLYVSLSLSIYIYICVYMYAYAYAYVCLYVSVHVHVHVHVQHVHVHVCMYAVYIYIHTYTYMCIYIYIYVYVYILPYAILGEPPKKGPEKPLHGTRRTAARGNASPTASSTPPGGRALSSVEPKSSPSHTIPVGSYHAPFLGYPFFGLRNLQPQSWVPPKPSFL